MKPATKNSEKPRNPVLNRFFGTLVVVAAGFLLLEFVVYEEFGNRPFNDRKFSRSIWMKPEHWYDDAERGRMADDVISNHLPPGMTRASVLQLLGEPSTEFASDGVTRYYIGSWSLFRVEMDDAWIDIEFDASNRVTRAFIAGG